MRRQGQRKRKAERRTPTWSLQNALVESGVVLDSIDLNSTDCIAANPRILDQLPLLPMQYRQDLPEKKRARAASEDADRNRSDTISWSDAPSTETLRTMGIQDQVEALTADVKGWSLENLRNVRKSLPRSRVKRQQAMVRRMLLTKKEYSNSVEDSS